MRRLYVTGALLVSLLAWACGGSGSASPSAGFPVTRVAPPSSPGPDAAQSPTSAVISPTATLTTPLTQDAAQLPTSAVISPTATLDRTITRVNYFGGTWIVEPRQDRSPYQKGDPYRIRLAFKINAVIRDVKIMIAPQMPKHQIPVIKWDAPLKLDPAFDPSHYRPAAYADRIAEPVGLYIPLLPANVPTQLMFEVTPDALPGTQLQVAVTAAYDGWPEGLTVTDSYWWVVPGKLEPEKFERNAAGTVTGVQYPGGYGTVGGVTPPAASPTPARMPTPTAAPGARSPGLR